jgi:hypothetical protein
MTEDCCTLTLRPDGQRVFGAELVREEGALLASRGFPPHWEPLRAQPVMLAKSSPGGVGLRDRVKRISGENASVIAFGNRTFICFR